MQQSNGELLLVTCYASFWGMLGRLGIAAIFEMRFAARWGSARLQLVRGGTMRACWRGSYHLRC
jgi:predicted ATPase